MQTIQEIRDTGHSAALTIAITATFTAEPVAEALAFWAEELGLPLRCVFAPYNQVFQQLLDPASLLAQNRHGINVVLVRLEDWERPAAAGHLPRPEAMSRLAGTARELAQAVQALVARSPLPLLLCLCPPSPAAEPGRAAAATRQDLGGRAGHRSGRDPRPLPRPGRPFAAGYADRVSRPPTLPRRPATTDAVRGPHGGGHGGGPRSGGIDWHG